MKKVVAVGIITVLLASLFVGLVPSSVVASPAWIIDGDKVYFNDTNVYLSATPHTLASSGWVYFNLSTKQYNGDIDVVWGFNTSNVKPTKAELYQPYYYNWTTNHQQTFYNVSSFTTSSDSCDYGNSYNTYHYNVTHQICDSWNEVSGECDKYKNVSSIVCFDSQTNDGTNYTAYWHTNHSKLILWKDISATFAKINYEHGGMNTWYYIKNVPVEAGKNYQVRAWVNVPISLEKTSGKYWWAVKPSSESISEAIANNHFYALDPWYNSSWNERKQWTISHVNTSGSTLTNYPAFINKSHETGLQADWDDGVFTDLDGNILPYELENYTDSYGLYWVNISLSTSGTSGYFYWNNSAATSQENPEGVWDSSAKMVQHLQEAPANDTAGHLDSTSNNNDGTPKNFNGTATSTTDATGKIDGADVFDGVDDYIDCGNDESLNITDAITVEAWIKFKDINDNVIVSGGVPTGSYYYLGIWSKVGTANKISFGRYSSWTYVEWATTPSIDTWYHTVATFDGSNIKLYINGKLVNTASDNSNLSAITETKIGQANYQDDASFNGTIDEVRIYNRALSAAWLNQSYEMVVNQSTWVSWGITTQNDTSFTVTLPVGYTYAHFNLTGVTNPSTQTNYEPEGQNSTTAFYNVTNTGAYNLSVRMNINSTIDNIILKADTDNNPTGAKEINTTFANLYTNLTSGSSIDIWLWTDLSHAAEQETNRTLEINVTQT